MGGGPSVPENNFDVQRDVVNNGEGNVQFAGKNIINHFPKQDFMEFGKDKV